MAPSFSDGDRERIILDLGRDKVLAHRVLFGDKHSNTAPAFHNQMIADWHSERPNVGTMAFRGAAKSTKAEEALCLECWFQTVQNVVILAENEARAVDRLRSIKHILETNDYAAALFQVGQGDIWTETKITLSNGIVIQAYGRGQSLRGVKHLDCRPDMIFMDDLEDEESVKTPEARKKVLEWFTKTVMPALTPGGRMRMAATPLHPEALAPTLAKSPAWLFRVFPIIFRNLGGKWEATWPDRYSLSWALAKKAELEHLGESDTWIQEYLCQAINPATQVFTPDMIRVVPRVRSWHGVFAMYDPARTTNAKSATTGMAVWSWIGTKMVIWDAFARKLMPDEIIESVFETEARFTPITIGIEETGLNEWLNQPLREAQRKRGITLPLRALNAPKGKMDFIRALQPYFRAGQIEFACDLPDLRDQLLGFPTGAIDAPNALAYALRLRLGSPVYDGFRLEHTAIDTRPNPRRPLWLAVNSDGRVTSAALCQIANGQFSIFADWLQEGEPGQVLADIVLEAGLYSPGRTSAGGKTPVERTQRTPLMLIAPRAHFDTYSVIGLRAAAKKIPAEMQKGGEIGQGRAELRRLFEKAAHGAPAVRVDERATWTLRALAGGFAKQPDQIEPDANPYRVVMEGVECMAALLRAAEGDSDNQGQFDYTPGGQRFRSARAR
jgi:hypothetical protein